MYGQNYVWMLPGIFFSNWFINDIKAANVNCTSENIQEVIEKYIAFKNDVLPKQSETPLSGYVCILEKFLDKIKFITKLLTIDYRKDLSTKR